jgi:hypothetical protein
MGYQDTCYNSISIKHPDPKKEEEVLAAYEAGTLLAYCAPLPADLDPDKHFRWKDNHWGTTRDIYDYEEMFAFEFYTDEPPLAAYDAAARLGFEISAEYHHFEDEGQPSEGYCGEYEPNVKHTHIDFHPHARDEDDDDDEPNAEGVLPVEVLERHVADMDFTGWEGGTYEVQDLPPVQTIRSESELDAKDDDSDLEAFRILAEGPPPTPEHWSEEEKEEFYQFWRMANAPRQKAKS